MFPPYTYVPGGPWPHPVSDPRGHSVGGASAATPPIDPERWEESAAHRRAIALFDAGYYWEAHELWERLWHAHQRVGPTADLLRALIKLAAAGVKVRQHQPHGIVTHARRAADLLGLLEVEVGPRWLGIELSRLRRAAESVAAAPPETALEAGAAAAPVLGIHLGPGRALGTSRPE